MSIKTYQKGSTLKLSANFNVSEFACHGSGCCTTVLIDEQLVKYLQQIRDHFGAAVTITSGYRCPTHNKNIGSSTGSRHAKGQACDIVVSGVAPAEVAKYAESIGILGIGLYETKKDGFFVHVDTRTTKAFWYGQAQASRKTFGGSTATTTTQPTTPTKPTTTKQEEYTLKQFIEDVQRICGAEEDGIAGPETLSKTVTLSTRNNRTHALVEPVQKRLKAMGYDPGDADGIYGSQTASAVQRLQKAINGKRDGIISKGKLTWKALLGMIQ